MSSTQMELADRLEDRLNRDRHGKVDPWLGIRVGPGICEDVIEAVAALRGVSGDEMDDFIRAVLADNNPRIDEPYATVAKWIRRLNRRHTALREREALQAIARTTFSGSEMSDDYIRGNQDAHATCARMARAALKPGGSDGHFKRRAEMRGWIVETRVVSRRVYLVQAEDEKEAIFMSTQTPPESDEDEFEETIFVTEASAPDAPLA